MLTAVICGAFVFSAPPCLAQTYNVTDLGNFEATSMNNSGDVVGFGYLNGVLYSGGKLTDLGTLGEGQAQPHGINDNAQVVGWASSGRSTFPFLYSGGSVDFFLGSTCLCGAQAINNAGEIVGNYSFASGSGFLFSGGKVTQLGFGIGSNFYAINNLGVVLGAGSVGVLYEDGVYTSLGTFIPLAINDLGEIAGLQKDSSGMGHAMLYTRGTLTDLGPGSASGINNHGDVVGSGPMGDAFLYSGGTMLDLSQFIPSCGINGSSAVAINDLGQILVSCNPGVVSFLLTPTNLSLAVSTASLADATSGQAYSAALTATGGSGTGHTWSLAAGSLPLGFTLSPSGIISTTGTPAAPAGSYTFVVQARDSAGNSAAKGFSLAVQPSSLQIITTNLPNATSGQSYSARLEASGGSGGYTWSAVPTSLPSGFSLSADGIVSSTGNPALPNFAYSFTVQVQDSSGATATQLVTLLVLPPVVPLSINTNRLPVAVSGKSYEQTLTASGGSGTGYSWSVSSGSLPAGFALSSNGVLSSSGNEPAATNVYPITVQVIDSVSDIATQSYVLCEVNVSLRAQFPSKEYMQASFAVPTTSGPLGIPLADYAGQCGFTSFNWQQTVTVYPRATKVDGLVIPNDPSQLPNNVVFPFCTQESAAQWPGSWNGTLFGCSLIAGKGFLTNYALDYPSFLDPPNGGYVDLPSTVGAYPLYYPPRNMAPGGACTVKGQCPGPNFQYIVSPDGLTLSFEDGPTDLSLPGDGPSTTPRPGSFLAFKTDLVGLLAPFDSQNGICSPNGSGLCTSIYSWTWNSTFNGTAGGVSQTAGGNPIDPGSGTGGTMITSINGTPQTEPSISCAANPNRLWPPDGKSVAVTVSGTVVPGTQPIPSEGMEFSVIDEYALVEPIGTFAMDAEGKYSFTVPLIAARRGDDLDGRTYTIDVAVKDAIGNAGSCAAVVTVPHDQRR